MTLSAEVSWGRRPETMYDNANLENRCRALWADVLCGIESRVSSVNDYVRQRDSRIQCRMYGADAVFMEHASVERSIFARLDLRDHGLQFNVFQSGRWIMGKKLPFSLLGDGGLYVTCDKTLMGDSQAVAKLLLSVLLNNSADPVSGAQLQEFRSWTAAIMTARAARSPIIVPVEILADNGIHQGSTLDMSVNGLRVQLAAELAEGRQVVVSRGSQRSDFRVVWAQRTGDETTAGLACLNPPLSWIQDAA